MKLVIVESPAKAKTIGRLLGRGYQVKASMGHLVDLPKSQLGIDLENNFRPRYITIRGKGKILQELKEAGKKAEKVYLATDPDREGEAISWHLSETLGLMKNKPCRVVFNEITKDAVKKAFSKPRLLDPHRFEAQQARRILDRIVGYSISPLLWKKVRKGLSAGRVQSVALKLICDREKEILAFEPEEYWNIEANLRELNNGQTFSAKFYGKQGKKITLSTESDVNQVLTGLDQAEYRVTKVRISDRKRHSAPPFTTSTLQQEASRKLGFSTKKTMIVAQQLYEGIEVGKKGESVGLITYMRTDATRISPQAEDEARQFIHEKYGKDYVPEKPRRFGTQKRAQDAHEAIRPTSVTRHPDKVKPYLTRDQYRVYKLIWDRFLASQMASAVLEQIRADISANDYIFKASGSKIKFPGFMILYIEGVDEEKESEHELPLLQEGHPLDLLSLNPSQHFTQPPQRYTEATLVKTMESQGIGRPSTYSPTIETILGRGYVIKDNKSLTPTELGFIVSDQLNDFFPEILDVDFTAQLEDKLDKVESGEVSWLNVLNEFYGPFNTRLKKAEEEMEKVVIQEEETGEICPQCGKNLVKKHGRYGPFLACPGFPDCRYTMQPKVETGLNCPDCDGNEGKIIQRRSKKGRNFFGCSNYPACKFVLWDKPVKTPCPQCGYVMVEKNKKGTGTTLHCAKKNCDYQETKTLEKSTANQ